MLSREAMLCHGCTVYCSHQCRLLADFFLTNDFFHPVVLIRYLEAKLEITTPLLDLIKEKKLFPPDEVQTNDLLRVCNSLGM